MLRAIKNRAGVTLVEIVVSIAILGIIVAPISGLFVSTINNNVRAKKKLIANQLAQERMEVIRNSINRDKNVLDNTGNIVGSYDKTYSAYNMVVAAEIQRVVDDNVSNNNGITDTLPIFDLDIELSNYTTIDDIRINIDETGSISINEATPSSPFASDPLNIKIDYDVNGNDVKNIIVTNKSGRATRIFKFKNNSDIKIPITVREGTVTSYTNINTEELISNDKGRVFRVKVTAKHNGEDLVELLSFVTVKGD